MTLIDDFNGDGFVCWLDRDEYGQIAYHLWHDHFKDDAEKYRRLTHSLILRGFYPCTTNHKSNTSIIYTFCDLQFDGEKPEAKRAMAILKRIGLKLVKRPEPKEAT